MVARHRSWWLASVAIVAGAVLFYVVRSSRRRAKRDDEEAAVEAAARAGAASLPSAPAAADSAAAEVKRALPRDPFTLFLDSPPAALYECGAALGGGGFGSVARGCARSTGAAVAIKTYTSAPSGTGGPSPSQSAAAVLRALRVEPGAPAAVAVEARVAARARAREEKWNAASRASALQEVAALQAVKALPPPARERFIDMLTAHYAGGHFFVVSALAGRTVDKALAGAPLRDRLTVMQRTAEALAHLHHCGCAHKDIKPQNIAVAKDDALQPVILDLGLMAVGDEGSAWGGTLPYMAPELFALSAAQKEVVPLAVAQQADVFALGVTFAEVLYDAPMITWLVYFTELLSAFVGARPGPVPEFAAFIAAEWSRQKVERFLVEAKGATRGALLSLVLDMLEPSGRVRARMADVATHAAFSITVEARRAGPLAGSGAPAVPPPPPALAGGAREVWRRNFARANRLALMRDVVRVVSAAEHAASGSTPSLARGVLPRLQAALGGATTVAPGALFDALLADAGLTPEVFPFEHGEVFALLDVDGSGFVDRRELLAGLAFLLAMRLPIEEEAALLFQAFDVDNSGALSREELREMLAAFGVPAASDTLEEARAEELQVEALFDRRAWIQFSDRVSPAYPPSPPPLTTTHARAHAPPPAVDTSRDGNISLEELIAGLREDNLLKRTVSGGGAKKGAGAAAPQRGLFALFSKA